MSKRYIKYQEGQWFVVPLRNGNYTLGIIVRGSFKTQGGLGYFLEPANKIPPNQYDTMDKKAEGAILITWFCDLGIITDEWQLIPNGKPFVKSEWPVPKFQRIDALDTRIGYLVEYEQENPKFSEPIRETICSSDDIHDLPKEKLSGSGAIEIILTKLLSK